MPNYEYRCETCGRAFEKLRRMQEADRDIQCPDCESGEVKRLLSSFATGGCGSGSGGGFT
jgi:putative FmdB family regulatory protein